MNENKSENLGSVVRAVHVELVRASADIIKINNNDETLIIMRSHAGSTIFEKPSSHSVRHMKVVHGS